MNDYEKIRCDYCGKPLEVYVASNGKHYCNEVHKAYDDVRISVAACRSQGIPTAPAIFGRRRLGGTHEGA